MLMKSKINIHLIASNKDIRGQKFLRWRKKYPKSPHTALTFILLFMLIVSTILPSKSRAETALFYSSACTGSWLNPKNAAGMPDLEANAKMAEFTDQNS